MYKTTTTVGIVNIIRIIQNSVATGTAASSTTVMATATSSATVYIIIV